MSLTSKQSVISEAQRLRCEALIFLKNFPAKIWLIQIFVLTLHSQTSHNGGD